MKYRPFFIIGIVTFSIIFLSVNFSAAFAYSAIAAGALLLIVLLFFKNARKSFPLYYLIFSLIISGAVFLSESYFSDIRFINKYYGKETAVIGTVTDVPEYSNYRYYYSVQTDSIGSDSIRTGLRLSSSEDLGLKPYDKIKINASVYEIGSDKKNIRLHYFSKGYYCGAYINNENSSVCVLSHNSSVGEYIFRFRQFIENKLINNNYGETGGVSLALLTGNKSLISDNRKAEFGKIGVSPVFAVSGLHLSVWVFGLYEILLQLKVSRKKSAVAAIVFTAFFVLVTGFSTSVFRASVMAVLMLSSGLFYRKADSLNSLGFALFVICLFNVYSVTDIGLLLSFSATFGIVVLMPFIKTYFIDRISLGYVTGFVKSLLSAVSVGLTAVIGSLPVTAFYIGYVPLITVISNIAVSYAAVVCMLFAGLTVMFSFVPFLYDLFSGLSYYFAGVVLKVCDYFSSLNVPVISLTDKYVRCSIVICLIVIVLSYLFIKKRRLRLVLISSLTAVTVLSSALISYFTGNSRSLLSFVNVGRGVVCILSDKSDKFLFISRADGKYAYSNTVSVLNEINHNRIKTVLLGSEDASYSSFSLEILKNYEFGSLITPVKNQSLSAVADYFQMTVSTERNIIPWKNAEIEYRYSDNCSFAYLTLYNTTFLIIFSADRKSVIPDEFTEADYLAVDGYIPGNLEVSTYKEVIICTSPAMTDSLSGYVFKNKGKVIKLADFNTVLFAVKPGNVRINYR